jgi:hypothetical protein
VSVSWSPTSASSEPRLAGLEIGREYHVERDGRWVRLDAPVRVARGDLVRVDLYLFAPGPRNFVVVDDPVPGGFEPVNRELGTTSEVDADEAQEEFPPDALWFRYDDWQSFSLTAWTFYHRELRHDAARFYSEYLPAGRYRLSYVAQAIAPGTFAAPAPRAEEMYDPDVFGTGVAGTIEVVEAGSP